MAKTTVFLRVTSAFAVDGVIAAAGSVVEVDEDLAVNLLNRGKAEPATAEDAPEADDAPDAPDAPEGDGEPQDPPKDAKSAKPDKPAK